MEKEIWKPLTYHGENFGDTYEISNTGKLRNKITGIERKQSFNKKGVFALRYKSWEKQKNSGKNT